MHSLSGVLGARGGVGIKRGFLERKAETRIELADTMEGAAKSGRHRLLESFFDRGLSGRRKPSHQLRAQIEMSDGRGRIEDRKRDLGQRLR